MIYHICRCSNIQQQGELFSIQCYPWGKNYQPPTTGSLVFLPDQGFFLRMHCEESNPTAYYTKNSDPVHTDSCMEAFLNFFPENQKEYINFEINPNGAMKCSIGSERNSPQHPRLYFEKEGIPIPRPSVTKATDFWEISLFIPLSFIKTAYGRCDFRSGQILRGNFYKCGENTPIPHFGTFFPVLSPNPDFHRPNDFGELILE